MRSSSLKKNRKKGFTIAELLIVITIMLILAGIAVPTFMSAIKKARISADVTNLRAIAMEYYSEAIVSGNLDDDGNVAAPKVESGDTSYEIEDPVCIAIDEYGAPMLTSPGEHNFETKSVTLGFLHTYKGVYDSENNMVLASGEFAWDSEANTFIFSPDDVPASNAGD